MLFQHQILHMWSVSVNIECSVWLLQTFNCQLMNTINTYDESTMVAGSAMLTQYTLNIHLPINIYTNIVAEITDSYSLYSNCSLAYVNVFEFIY